MLTFTPQNLDVEPQGYPKISIIILTKDKVDYLQRCIDSILMQQYPKDKLEVIIGDTGSTDDSKKQISKMVDIADCDLRYVMLDNYHFSKNNNEIVQSYVSENSEKLLFLNNDVEFLNNVLEQMVFVSETSDDIGTIGCQLFFYEGTVQHQGFFIQESSPGQYGVGHKKMWSWDFDWQPRVVTGNTGACLFIDKKLFNEIGGFNEIYDHVFQDVELNLECLRLGKKNICVGSAYGFHDESSSRKMQGDYNEKILSDLRKHLTPYLDKNRWYFRERIEKKYKIKGGLNGAIGSSV